MLLLIRILHRLLIIPLALLGTTLTGVAQTGVVEEVTLDLSVRHVVHARPLLLNSLRYQDSATNTFSVTRLSYLLHNFQLERADGTLHTLTNQTMWMDLAARRTRGRLYKIPAGDYRRLRFDVGIPPELNKSERAWPPRHPLNPVLNALHWDWETGYIFLALEGRFRLHGERDNTGYVWHLAREANRTPVQLVLPLDLNHNAELTVSFDLARLLNVPQAILFSKETTSTHSHDGDPLAANLRANVGSAFQPLRLRSHRPSPPPDPVEPLYLPKQHTPFVLKLPRGLSPPALPRDNPLTTERIALGKALFHEKALSRDQTISCASCHQQDAGLADPRRVSVGVDGRKGTRNAMPLFNLAWKSEFLWDGRSPSLRAQALEPFGDHREFDLEPAVAAERLNASADYRAQFEAAFGQTNATPETIGLAIENYLLTELSFDSRFDRALAGKEKLTTEEQRGFELFMTEYEPRSGRRGADCFHCHGGPLFTDNRFHNNGVDYEPLDQGRYEVTKKPADLGLFISPTLRNIERTAPYMHDGRFDTLEEVIDHYDTFVQNAKTLDPNLAKRVRLDLTDADKAALVAFLKTLTDPAFSGSKPVPLLNGKNLDGWESKGRAVWKVEDGILIGGQDGDPTRSGVLRTVATYADFDLSLEFLIDEHGKYNSGVYLRDVPGRKGPRYQVNIGRGAAGEPVGLYSNRWLDKGDEADEIRKPNAWNQLRIRAEGPRIRVWLNGTSIVDYTEATPTEAQLGAGSLALQTYGAEGHAGFVKFRKIEITDLGKK